LWLFADTSLYAGGSGCCSIGSNSRMHVLLCCAWCSRNLCGLTPGSLLREGAAAVSWPWALLIGMLQLGAARLMPAPSTQAFNPIRLLFVHLSASCCYARFLRQ
jgi:hypothetical protein